MVKRCVLGCYPHKTLFPFPKIPWLRARWLEFLHFEEGGISESSRLCGRHFAPECFTNLKQYEMGFSDFLYLIDTAVPTVYTVGPSQSLKPLTREVGCQCHGPLLKNASVQAIRTQKKPKIRSKAIQVKPLVSHCASVSCSEEDFAVSPKPPFTLLPIKRPRMEESTVESTKGSWLHRTEKPTDSTFQIPTVKQEDDVKLEPCDSSYIVVTI
ncbi:THAP domain-containing protein 10-like isoform X2 [Myxocyprinus asiaticus]|uniref:THAP domain-containing protein 10-like isoform X2 n=1 Tax=Myxocyprinus asiaticus TaxID=70543 RepID=UPI002221485B|nr:THAP domain-containing protein 10-like isoform X2 [Myxocyprinus asiaticus]